MVNAGDPYEVGVLLAYLFTEIINKSIQYRYMENPLTIREMALRSGQPAIDRYMDDSEGQDPDFIAIKKSLLVDGSTFYESIRLRWLSGESNRSEGTLRHHARGILMDIYEVFGGGMSSKIDQLTERREVHIEYDAATLLRSALESIGTPFVEDIRFRLSEEPDNA